ncbi:hypothetical protein FVO59_11980 [Microbacterium esteraromaticum]|uniref:Uncharacterized protein n=1 Tax=Microbacterium esteraromaticum TaxID=57043 RepID=A0A7D8ADY5_9MICO|nr:hypothetical protein [Microbacterium esteraromaticum]QMU97844.1 hypothetical protein FVO59_11980 [Microbacterium esteraromaticum]
MTRFVRVKNKTTGHEFDLPSESFDPEKYSKVARYSETTRPRRPKPNVRKGGKRIAPVKTDKEKDQ